MTTETKKKYVFLGHCQLQGGKAGERWCPVEKLAGLDDTPRAINAAKSASKVFSKSKGSAPYVGTVYEIPTEEEGERLTLSMGQRHLVGLWEDHPGMILALEAEAAGLKQTREEERQLKRIKAQPQALRELEKLRALRRACRFNDELAAFDAGVLALLRKKA